MAETERRYLPSRSVLFISKAAIFFFFFFWSFLDQDYICLVYNGVQIQN
jgi:hypothetical protein